MYEGMVEVRAKSTGLKQTIPEHWLDHPVLGKDFELTPTGKAQQAQAEGPSLDWTLAQLTEHADDHGVDRTGLRSKADVLSAIEAHAAAAAAPQNADVLTQGEGQAAPGDDVDGTPTTDSQE